MKINAINNVNLQKTSKVSQNFDNTFKNQTYPQTQTISNYPKSYISFTSRYDTLMMEDIQKYLKYKDFNPELEEAKYKIDTQKEIAMLRKSRRVKKSEKLQIEERYRQQYIEELGNYTQICIHSQYYKDLVKTADVETYEKLQTLQKSNNSMDKIVAGYDKEKEYFRKLLVAPIRKEKTFALKEKIVPSLLLYGPIGCGKSSFAKAIADEAGVNVVCIKHEDVNSLQFPAILSAQLRKARKNYLKVSQDNDEIKKSNGYLKGTPEEKARVLMEMPSPRTIIIIDEVDQFLNPDLPNNTEAIVNNNKTFLKGALDHCSEAPSGEFGEDAAGVTFILTTNYPSKIDSEIALRKGKCVNLPILPPSDQDVEKVLKLHFKKANETLRNEMNNPNNPNKDFIELIDTDKLPLKTIINNVNKNKSTLGPISCGGIVSALDSAVQDYLKNPNLFINVSLADNLNLQNNRISIQKMEDYMQEVEKMGKQITNLDEKEEYELFKELKELDMMENHQLKRFNYLQKTFEKASAYQG